MALTMLPAVDVLARRAPEPIACGPRGHARRRAAARRAAPHHRACATRSPSCCCWVQSVGRRDRLAVWLAQPDRLGGRVPPDGPRVRRCSTSSATKRAHRLLFSQPAGQRLRRPLVPGLSGVRADRRSTAAATWPTTADEFGPDEPDIAPLPRLPDHPGTRGAGSCTRDAVGITGWKTEGALSGRSRSKRAPARSCCASWPCQVVLFVGVHARRVSAGSTCSFGSLP